MAQFLVLLKRNYDRFTEADFAPLLEPEANHARALYTQGFVRQMYGRTDLPGAVMIVESATIEEARNELSHLPLAAKGMLDFEVIPLAPYRGFAPRG